VPQENLHADRSCLILGTFKSENPKPVRLFRELPWLIRKETQKASIKIAVVVTWFKVWAAVLEPRNRQRWSEGSRCLKVRGKCKLHSGGIAGWWNIPVEETDETIEDPSSILCLTVPRELYQCRYLRKMNRTSRSQRSCTRYGERKDGRHWY
jgi:hypothetical protein